MLISLAVARLPAASGVSLSLSVSFNCNLQQSFQLLAWLKGRKIAFVAHFRIKLATFNTTDLAALPSQKCQKTITVASGFSVFFSHLNPNKTN